MAHYKFADILKLLKTTAGEFVENNSFRHAAALSYYTIFSLPPLLLIVITAASAVYGREAVTGQVYGQLRGLVGPDSAKFLQDAIAQFTLQDRSAVATVIGVATLIFAATTFFVTLQESINDIWNVKVKPTDVRGGVGGFVRQRFLSFGLILSVALLLLISFVLSAVLSAFTGWLQQLLPAVGVVVLQLVDFVLSMGLTTLLFAMIYRFLPDAIIRWRDVSVGAFITALFFVLGKFLIAFYIAKSSPGSAFGAAGSAIVLLLWVNYSSLIIFFGAEFTQEFADTYGQTVQPKAYAVRVKTVEVRPEETKEALATGRPKAEGKWEK